jgi:hypothetical protein
MDRFGIEMQDRCHTSNNLDVLGETTIDNM